MKTKYTSSNISTVRSIRILFYVLYPLSVESRYLESSIMATAYLTNSLLIWQWNFSVVDSVNYILTCIIFVIIALFVRIWKNQTKDTAHNSIIIAFLFYLKLLSYLQFFFSSSKYAKVYLLYASTISYKQRNYNSVIFWNE